MSEIKLTPEEFAQIMKANKPHLIMLEESFEELGYGECDVRFKIRAGVVTEMSFFSKKIWLRDKSKAPIDLKPEGI